MPRSAQTVLIAATVLGIVVLVAYVIWSYSIPYHESVSFVVPPNADVTLTQLVGEAQSRTTENAEGGPVKIIYERAIVIPTSLIKMGRGWTNFDYRPDVWPVLTSRQPVDRVWNRSENKGTSTKYQAFQFESADGINFDVGGVLIARVPDGHSQYFRYHNARKSPAQFVDEQIQPELQRYMGRRFSQLPFASNDPEHPEDCYSQLIPIFKDAMAHARSKFGIVPGDLANSFGVQIEYFGCVDGIHPVNEERQLKLDNVFIASMEQQIAIERNRVQEVLNRMNIARSLAAQQAAELRFEASVANQLKTQFEAILARERAINLAAMKWGGVKLVNGQYIPGEDGPRGSLPKEIMPANFSPLGWLKPQPIELVLAEIPEELDPELVANAQQILAEIRSEKEEQSTEQPDQTAGESSATATDPADEHAGSEVVGETSL